MPGTESGSVTFRNVCTGFAPRSPAASIRLVSNFISVVYIGRIMNGRKSYVIPMTEFKNGCRARFPSNTVSISFNAVIRNVKLIHIGITNATKITLLCRILLRAKIYAIGYASSTQTQVVTTASAKLYASVPIVFGLVKNAARFCTVN